MGSFFKSVRFYSCLLPLFFVGIFEKAHVMVNSGEQYFETTDLVIDSVPLKQVYYFSVLPNKIEHVCYLEIVP